MDDEILKKYFEEKMKQVDIATELNVSKYKVSRVVTKDPRYKTEKERRKESNRKKNREETKKYISKERKKRKDDIAYEQLRQAHIQATMELSGGRKTISNRAFRNWNSSIYKYNEKNQSYQLKSGINVGADVPKTIKWK